MPELFDACMQNLQNLMLREMTVRTLVLIVVVVTTQDGGLTKNLDCSDQSKCSSCECAGKSMATQQNEFELCYSFIIHSTGLVVHEFLYCVFGIYICTMHIMYYMYLTLRIDVF